MLSLSAVHSAGLPEVLVGLLQLDDVHEPCWVGGVGAHLAVNLHQALHQNHLHLLASQRIPGQAGGDGDASLQRR